MSSFKEIKKREKIKAWQSKIKRLYASESINEDDIKYLNIQYDLYKVRKTNSYIWGFSAGGLTYIFPLLSEMFWAKRILLSGLIGIAVYNRIKKTNRFHYENLIMPYFEKYYIK